MREDDDNINNISNIISINISNIISNNTIRGVKNGQLLQKHVMTA